MRVFCSPGHQPHNDHGHLCRAVCCRVYDELCAELPHPYTINHPTLQFCHKPVLQSISAAFPQPTHLSINWNGADALLEIVDGKTGTAHQE